MLFALMLAAFVAILNETVLVAWGRRCGRACAERWNTTVGPIVNLRIPVDRL